MTIIDLLKWKWNDDVSLRDDTLFNFDRLHGHNQVTRSEEHTSELQSR